MITSFFKPKSGKKITPEPSDGSTAASSVSLSKKRVLEESATAPLSTSPSEKRSKSNDDAAVRELISYLNTPESQQDTDVEHEVAWRDVLDKHFSTPSFARLANFVAAQRYVNVTFPFNHC